jgi:2-oxoglutarate dehydrogenase E1 component
LTPSLVLLLPHGYEGQGPDHSSARLERFLQSAADINIRIVYPTTTAQYFHMLRRQALLLKTDPLPLAILTPKSLLRNPAVYSRPRELAEGCWEPVIDDGRAKRAPEKIRRLALCSGKIYVDLAASELYKEGGPVAIARLEQIYPVPMDDLRSAVEGYPNLEEVMWVQEEPENMGAWRHMQPHLARLSEGRWGVHYLGRPENSSPAEGSAAWHAVNQSGIVEQAFLYECRIDEKDVLWMKMT